MGENVEKIICCAEPNRGGNDLLAGVLAGHNNQGNDWWPMMAMMNGGMNNWMNNPFAYMMMMAWMRNFNGNWGDGNGQGAQNVEMQSQLQAIRTQLQDNQNAALLRDAIGDGFNRNDFALSQLSQNLGVDFNMLQKCCCEVQAAIQNVAGQVGFSAERVINAANMGDCRVIEALKDCCCGTKQLIQEMGYQNQLGQKDIQFTTERGFCQLGRDMQTGMEFINRSIERGFAASDYATQKQTCDIITAQNAGTQRIIDTLNNHWNDENQRKIQDLKFELSQERQNNLILNRLNGCGCGNGCHNNGCGCGCGQ